MGVTVRPKNKTSYVVTVHEGGQREMVYVKTKQDADDLARYIRRQLLAGLHVTDTIRAARQRRQQPTIMYPTLREGLSAWIDSQVQKREIRQTTGRYYHQRARVWLYPQLIADGRVLGDLPVNEVQRMSAPSSPAYGRPGARAGSSTAFSSR